MGDAADDLFDSMFMDDWGDPLPPKRRRPATVVTCNRCGTRDLRWQNVKGGAWRLHTKEGQLHNCGHVERYLGVTS